MKYLKILIVIILVVNLVSSPHSALAANTHSTDVERNSSQYWSLADDDSFDFADALTIDMWIKFETVDTQYPTMKANGSGSDGSWFLRAGTDLGFIGWSSTRLSCDESVAWSPSAATWYRITVTKSGTTLKFYVDGVQQGANQTCLDTDLKNTTYSLNIGHAFGTYSDGRIDDVRFWNKVQTPDATCTELVGNESGLVAYYKFNNDGTDEVDAAQNLTNNNSATFSTDTDTCFVVTAAPEEPPSIFWFF